MSERESGSCGVFCIAWPDPPNVVCMLCVCAFWGVTSIYIDSNAP